MKYQKLNQEQMYVLEALIHQGHSNQAIAEELGVHRTTVWRERKRHTIQKGQNKGCYRATKHSGKRSREKRASHVRSN
ncbi:MAG: helix-turn-helix domain-containing protein [Flavobacteriaceae bacterium]|nr:helix-turn-helix domain-containing protein [Flavobacteriaceae bacterium]